MISPPPKASSWANPLFEAEEALDDSYTDLAAFNSFATYNGATSDPAGLDVLQLDDVASHSSDSRLLPDDLNLHESIWTRGPFEEEPMHFDKTSSWLSEVLGTLDTESEMNPIQPPIQSEALMSHNTATLPASIQDHSTILIEYYFKEVCGMMSCYDSQMNPYRTTISNTWSNSSPLYFIVQSMSAACLADVYPEFAHVGKRLQQQGMRVLYKNMRAGHQMEMPSLMALVMLGFSMSWHDASSLGQGEFELLCKALDSIEKHTDQPKQTFFYNSLVYARMLLSFVTDTQPSMPTTRKLLPQTECLELEPHLSPHPQTGIGMHVLELVAQVGRLVRRERNRIQSRQYSSRVDIQRAEEAVRLAEQLHEQLCAVKLPSEASVLDTGDDLTPPSHLLQVAEAYRLTGLLQLYRNFPDLLITQLGISKAGTGPLFQSPKDYPEPNHEAETVTGSWLTRLAMHINDMVQEIPITSRSKSIQPLLLVSICSELSLHRRICSIDTPGSPILIATSSRRFLMTPSITDILQARRALLARLSAFKNMLAAKPIARMITLVKRTWESMDNNRQDTNWMDVMIEGGFETLMG